VGYGSSLVIFSQLSHYLSAFPCKAKGQAMPGVGPRHYYLRLVKFTPSLIHILDACREPNAFGWSVDAWQAGQVTWHMPVATNGRTILPYTTTPPCMASCACVHEGGRADRFAHLSGTSSLTPAVSTGHDYISLSCVYYAIIVVFQYYISFAYVSIR